MSFRPAVCRQAPDRLPNLNIRHLDVARPNENESGEALNGSCQPAGPVTSGSHGPCTGAGR
jgi:hypothetical protein